MTREEKIERYTNAVVESMDHKTMYQALYEYIYESIAFESDEYIEDAYNEYFEVNKDLYN